MLRAFSIFLVLFVFTLHSKEPIHSSVSIDWGVGYTQYNAEELNRLMELFAKKTSDSSAGFNNFAVEKFDGHPFQLFEMGYHIGPISFALELDYWSEEFKQQEIAFYTGRNQDPATQNLPSLSCEFLSTHLGISNEISGCVKAREAFYFFPLTWNTSYQVELTKRLNSSIGLGIGYLGGFAEVQVTTDYYSGRSAGDDLLFQIDIGDNLVGKLYSELSYKIGYGFALALRAGYRYSQMSQLKVSKVRGSSEIFEIVLGKTMEPGQDVVIENFPGLGKEGEELNILKESEYFKPAEFYNKIQGDLNGVFLNLRIRYQFYLD